MNEGGRKKLKEYLKNQSAEATQPDTEKTMVIIAGNGGTAFNEEDITKLRTSYERHYGHVICIGDGKQNVELKEIEATMESLKGQEFDVCIYTHGVSTNGFSFVISDGTEKEISPEKLFEKIAAATEKPINMSIFSCHGGGSLHAADLLP